ncbi:nuclear envelope protein [Venturia nashicola]|nr:nuclear envelope protein [Venturia nashicola]
MATIAPVVKRPRPYRDFLTPALHRRFTSAALLALAVCYVDAVWMAEWNGLNFIWQLQPFSYTGIRAPLLFISALVVAILRVSRTHIGTRATTSPLQTLWKELFHVSTYLTFVWYMLSAWVFSEVYIWGRPAEAKLRTTFAARPHERGVKINERAVAFRAIFLTIGFIQSFWHMIKDVDKVAPHKTIADTNSKQTSVVEAPLIQLRNNMRRIVTHAAKVASAALPGVFFYLVTPIRSIAWGWGYRFLKKFYTLTPGQTENKSGLAPFPDFLFRLTTEIFLLIVLWETTNTAYSAYISQEPVKKGRPLTDDSKDPNGSLINGLKANKQFARASAFWELSMITSRFPDRRQTIYDEIDRSGGSAFSQILALSLAQVSAVNSRISAYNATAVPAPPPPEEQYALARVPQAALLKTDPIWADGTAKPNLAKTLAKQYGNSPGAKPIHNALEFGSKKLFSPAQRERLKKQPEIVEKKVESWWTEVLKSPLGYFLRKPFSRLATKVVCGKGGYSESGVLVDAISAVTILVKEALREDTFATVQKEIPNILSTFAETINAIEGFLGSLAPHSTDVFFTQESRQGVVEVNEVLQALKDSTGVILMAYGEYLTNLGMNKAQISEVKAVANVPRKDKEKKKGVEGAPEMAQI